MSAYQQVGVMHSLDPVTKERRGFVEVGYDDKGNVMLRTVRSAMDSTTRFTATMAIRIAELMSRAACGSPDKSAAKEAARKMTATHLHRARELLDLARDENQSERDRTRLLANALSEEMRRGVALAQHADGDSALLAALEIGNEPEQKDAGNGLGL